jgi:hypothetical protein
LFQLPGDLRQVAQRFLKAAPIERRRLQALDADLQVVHDPALPRQIGLMTQALGPFEHAVDTLGRELPYVFQEHLPFVEERHHRLDQCRPLSA